MRCAASVTLAMLFTGLAALAETPQAAQSISQAKTAEINDSCGPGQKSKVITATVTVTNQEGLSASKSTKITVNCSPPYLRLPDLIFFKNSTKLDTCSKRILIDQAASIATMKNYRVVLLGYRSPHENASTSTGEPLDYARAVDAGAVLVRCGLVSPASIKIGTAGTATSPVPTSIACSGNTSGGLPSDWYSRVEVYLMPKDSSYMPPNAHGLEVLPASLPRVGNCATP
jgi:hypothetical protein